MNVESEAGDSITTSWSGISTLKNNPSACKMEDLGLMQMQLRFMEMFRQLSHVIGLIVTLQSVARFS